MDDVITKKKANDAPLRLSVVMATYNGATYLPAQLESLAVQHMLPAELICFDDASTDDTIAVLQDFARAAPFEMRVLTRERNVGPHRNFDEAIRLATGDIVLCCDQDDVWLPQKLQRVAERFQENPDLGLLLNDAVIVRADLTATGETLWQIWHLNDDLQRRINAGRGFEVFSQHVPPYGCTMSFRAELVALVPEVPPDTTFDLWFGRILAVLTECALVQEPLQLYRQHGSQVTGFTARTVLGRFAALRRQARPEVLVLGLQRADQVERALHMLDIHDARAAVAKRWLRERAAFDRVRLSMRLRGLAGTADLIRLLRGGHYRTVSAGWPGAVVDVVGMLDRSVNRVTKNWRLKTR